MAKSPAVQKAAPAPSAPVRIADPGLARANVLAHDAVPGRYGAVRDGGPGVTLSVRHPLSIVTVIARKGKLAALDEALRGWLGKTTPGPNRTATGKGVTIAWAAPEQWFLVAEGRVDGALYADAQARLQGLASVSDQGHGRIVIRLSGPKARAVLAKGTAVDFHPRSFGPGQCAVTQMAHIGVHVTQVDADSYDLQMFRGFSEGFWEWLTEMAEEYGYEVR